MQWETKPSKHKDRVSNSVTETVATTVGPPEWEVKEGWTSTEPCGTPWVWLRCEEDRSLTRTNHQIKMSSSRLNQWNVPVSDLSNAALRCEEQTQVDRLQPRDDCYLQVIRFWAVISSIQTADLHRSVLFRSSPSGSGADPHIYAVRKDLGLCFMKLVDDLLKIFSFDLEGLKSLNYWAGIRFQSLIEDFY